MVSKVRLLCLAKASIFMVPHYQRLGTVSPDAVHVMMEGKVVLSGGLNWLLVLSKKVMRKSLKSSVTSTTKKRGLFSNNRKKMCSYIKESIIAFSQQ